FLLLPPLFYIWSIHSQGNSVRVPTLPPHDWYNTRYAMAFLPLVALGAAALASIAKKPVLAAIVAIMALSSFLIHPATPPVTWQESDVNSRGRRAWSAQAVAFLESAGGARETYFTSFGDLTTVYRALGVPLKQTLTGDNFLEFMGASSRPDLFLHEDWAVVMGGDAVQTIIDKARLRGPRYELSDRIIVKNQPVIEIYHRLYENPIR